jgi:hypothetical protein
MRPTHFNSMIGCDFVLISARRTNKPHGSHGRYDPASSNSRRALDVLHRRPPRRGLRARAARGIELLRLVGDTDARFRATPFPHDFRTDRHQLGELVLTH